MIKILCFFCIFCCPIHVAAMEGQKSARQCHCFQDRAFDPARKFAADSYLLTTNFNSFVSASFHISKSQIVMMKMKGGVEGNDLLLALYAAQISDVKLSTLLAALDNGGTWKQILESESMLQQKWNADILADLVGSKENKNSAAERVTDHLLQDYFQVSEKEITALREKGATGREITLLFNLQRCGKIGKNATEILAMYKEQQMSWGEIAHTCGLTPKDTGKLFLEEDFAPVMQ